MAHALPCCKRSSERSSRERPLVVVFDDIHWAEPTFLELLRHIVTWTREAPMLLICMARHELLDDHPDWPGGMPEATTALLEPLSLEESDRLIENLLGEGQLESAARERMVHAGEGNPLFLEVSMTGVSPFSESRPRVAERPKIPEGRPEPLRALVQGDAGQVLDLR